MNLMSCVESVSGDTIQYSDAERAGQPVYKFVTSIEWYIHIREYNEGSQNDLVLLQYYDIKCRSRSMT